jgi:hypothetical protein
LLFILTIKRLNFFILLPFGTVEKTKSFYFGTVEYTKISYFGTVEETKIFYFGTAEEWDFLFCVQFSH